jgi:phosphatidylglycerophosphate synthase
VSSPVGSYYDRLTDQVQVTLWFGAAGYAAYAQTLNVVPVFLALIGIAFYGLRGYTKYVALEIETARDADYPANMARLKRREPEAGLGFGVVANLKWFLREQHKVLAFDEGVFIFMLSAALIFDQLTPMLWIFAASQVFWGTFKSWQRGKNIDANQKLSIQK